MEKKNIQSTIFILWTKKTKNLFIWKICIHSFNPDEYFFCFFLEDHQSFHQRFLLVLSSRASFPSIQYDGDAKNCYANHMSFTHSHFFCSCQTKATTKFTIKIDKYQICDQIIIIINDWQTDTKRERENLTKLKGCWFFLKQNNNFENLFCKFFSKKIFLPFISFHFKGVCGKKKYENLN